MDYTLFEPFDTIDLFKLKNLKIKNNGQITFAPYIMSNCQMVGIYDVVCLIYNEHPKTQLRTELIDFMKKHEYNQYPLIFVNVAAQHRERLFDFFGKNSVHTMFPDYKNTTNRTMFMCLINYTDFYNYAARCAYNEEKNKNADPIWQLH